MNTLLAKLLLSLYFYKIFFVFSSVFTTQLQVPDKIKLIVMVAIIKCIYSISKLFYSETEN